MREIKFRAWMYRKMLYNVFPTGKNGECYSFISNLYYKCDHNIMQYTGLKDKNGKEIYEGDILEYTTEISSKKTIGKVEFYNGCFVVGRPKDYIYIIDNIEIIGNIYENPELLNQVG